MQGRTVLVAAALIAGALAPGVNATIAQELPLQRPADIRIGSCATPGDVVMPLSLLTVPPGETQGLEGATAVEQSVTAVPMLVADLLATGHVVTIYPSPEEVGTPIACGEIGGALASDGTLAVGLNAMNGAKASGVAYFAPTPEGDGTTVTLLVVDERAGRRGADGADGTDAADGSAGTVGADGAAGTAGEDGADGQDGADGTDGAAGAAAPVADPATTTVIEGSPATAGEDGVITISADYADGANAKPDRNRDKVTADRDANGNAGSATSDSATEARNGERGGQGGGARAGEDGGANG